MGANSDKLMEKGKKHILWGIDWPAGVTNVYTYGSKSHVHCDWRGAKEFLIHNAGSGTHLHVAW